MTDERGVPPFAAFIGGVITTMMDSAFGEPLRAPRGQGAIRDRSN